MVKGSWWQDATGHEKGRSGQETRAARALRTSWQHIENVTRNLLNLQILYLDPAMLIPQGSLQCQHPARERRPFREGTLGARAGARRQDRGDEQQAALEETGMFTSRLRMTEITAYLRQ